jgi:hypothetical protein
VFQHLNTILTVVLNSIPIQSNPIQSNTDRGFEFLHSHVDRGLTAVHLTLHDQAVRALSHHVQHLLHEMTKDSAYAMAWKVYAVQQRLT